MHRLPWPYWALGLGAPPAAQRDDLGTSPTIVAFPTLAVASRARAGLRVAAAGRRSLTEFVVR